MSSSSRTEAPTTILLVEADPAARSTIAAVLLRRTCDRTIEARSPEVALYVCGVHAVDLIAVAAGLPGIGAAGLCAELRSGGGPPILAYRMGVDPEIHVRWLEAGGADSLASDDPELLAVRCRSALRRIRDRLAPQPSPWHHHVG